MAALKSTPPSCAVIPAKKDLKAVTNNVTIPICTICREEITDVEKVRLDNCRHNQFHRECIQTWSQIDNHCPLCKVRFNEIQTVITIPSSSTKVKCHKCGLEDDKELSLLCMGCDKGLSFFVSLRSTRVSRRHSAPKLSFHAKIQLIIQLASVSNWSRPPVGIVNPAKSSLPFSMITIPIHAISNILTVPRPLSHHPTRLPSPPRQQQRPRRQQLIEALLILFLSPLLRSYRPRPPRDRRDLERPPANDKLSKNVKNAINSFEISIYIKRSPPLATSTPRKAKKKKKKKKTPKTRAKKKKVTKK